MDVDSESGIFSVGSSSPESQPGCRAHLFPDDLQEFSHKLYSIKSGHISIPKYEVLIGALCQEVTAVNMNIFSLSYNLTDKK